ncbi:Uncharacterized protein Adt_45587 [Abeliophyllum distichum]|uniref:Putative plant transposon protein domain-containing protein n=1 Tax=Abeliophyllum distichum TaxID=126358 RepID=A0ABD1PE34_9LAMI
MSAKRTRGERLPSPSSTEEEDPQLTRFDRCPVLIGKNVDLSSFTFEAPSFHIEDLFEAMAFTPLRPFLTFDEEYDPVAACCRVTGKHFDAPTRLSTNQLTLTCRVLHNIIAHIIVPRKGHHDEVNHYDVFLLDSILLGRKLDFPYIMIQHMNSVLSGSRPKALPYGMILTKVFDHFGVSVLNTTALIPKATDTINILTLKRMKIFKENGQWVAKSKGFDDESGPSTLPFEGEDMDADEDAPPPSPPRPRSHQPSSSTSGIHEDQFNLLSGRIDSLTSTVDGMQLAVNDLHNTATTIQATVDGIQATVGGLQSSVDGITSMLHALHSYLGTGFPPPPPPEI